MMNKDLIDFTKKILSRYNATPDEWDAFESACEPPDSKLRDRISELEACIRQMCNNALDLGYCDMRDCHDCKTFKVCGVEE